MCIRLVETHIETCAWAHAHGQVFRRKKQFAGQVAGSPAVAMDTAIGTNFFWSEGCDRTQEQLVERL